jgi:hypothetical protein
MKGWICPCEAPRRARYSVWLASWPAFDLVAALGSCRYLMGGIGLLGAGICSAARYRREIRSIPHRGSRFGAARRTGAAIPSQCQTACLAFAVDTALATLGPD